MKITVEGTGELNRKLNSIPRKAKDGVKQELMTVLFDLQGESQRRAPIDTGALRGSAFAEQNGLEGTVGFTEIYALYQHEGVGFNHPKGGEAKYLENPFKQRINRYINAIGNAVKRAVE